ncbi:MAG: 30S ribosomal protein S8 [Deltaproteobacteria bacterium]|nr:30S ribosomal protein S8 [Deltaproteobacteria bacterium]MBI4374191.1 30S ribosomal protein S8 [Deltaproteobacteria bacterium]
MLDSLSDLLARIKNAQKAGHDEVRLPFFRLGLAVIKTLEQEGYLGGFRERTDEGKKWIEVRLRYVGRRKPLIQRLSRFSRPGRRVYRGHADIPQVRSGIGFAILSTSQGVMTDRQAREKKIGGEVLCTVY